MSRPDAIEVSGEIEGALHGGAWLVRLPNGHRLAGRASRTMNCPGLLAPGAKVRLEVSPCDLSKGRIIWSE